MTSHGSNAFVDEIKLPAWVCMSTRQLRFLQLSTSLGYGCGPDAEAGADGARCLPDDAGKSLPVEPVSQQHSRRRRRAVGQRVASTSSPPGHRLISDILYTRLLTSNQNNRIVRSRPLASRSSPASRAASSPVE